MLPEDLYLTPEQVVRELRNSVTTATLANWRARKEGPLAVKIGRKVFYRREYLHAWIADRERAAAAEHGWVA